MQHCLKGCRLQQRDTSSYLSLIAVTLGSPDNSLHTKCLSHLRVPSEETLRNVSQLYSPVIITISRQYDNNVCMGNRLVSTRRCSEQMPWSTVITTAVFQYQTIKCTGTHRWSTSLVICTFISLTVRWELVWHHNKYCLSGLDYC